MNERDSQLDTLLEEHFAAKLDPQLGKSVDRFLREVGEMTPHLRLTDAPFPPQRNPWRSLAWSLGLAGGAVAAGFAVVMMFSPSVNAPRNVVTNAQNPVVVAPDTVTEAPTLVSDIPDAQNVEHALSWQTLDRGTVYLDDETPLKSLVRQQVETLSFYDPMNKAQVEMQIPRSDVMLVGYESQ